MIQRIIFTAVFGFLRWNIFNYVGAGPSYLMILGSVLAVCACCCKGGSEPSREFNYQQYLTCIRRCRLNTMTLMIGLILVGILVMLFMGGSVAGMRVGVHYRRRHRRAAVLAPYLLRLR